MPVFSCKMCGHCCEGLGGIVLTPRCLARIASHLGCGEDEFAARYAERRNGKLVIRTGSDGYCVFFRVGKGCGVHPGKPDVCRAWPFFRGNLTDAVSLDLARAYCPGIGRASFADFREEGLQHLREQGLGTEDAENAPNALKILTCPAGIS